MIKVSVIVPIYNAGVYLNDCLLALQNQTLQEAEFILVLDCPTDGSDSVARQFAEKDKRFIVMENKENLHIGQSRNYGLQHAHGEYVAFCDHDDCMLPDMYEKMYNEALLQQADILLSTPAIEEDDVITTWEDIRPQAGTNYRDYMLRDLLSFGGAAQGISHFSYIHPNLYKRQLITDYALTFVDTKVINPEDVLFNIETAWYAKRIFYTPHPYYHHRMLESSTGHQTAYINWEKRFRATEYVYDFLQKQNAYAAYKEDFYLMAQKKLSDGLISILCNHLGFWAFVSAYRQARRLSFTKEAFAHYRDDIPRPYAKKMFRALLAFLLAH